MKITTTTDETMIPLPDLLQPVCELLGEAAFYTVTIPRSYDRLSAEGRRIADAGGWPIILEVRGVPPEHQRLIRFFFDQALRRGAFETDEVGVQS